MKILKTLEILLKITYDYIDNPVIFPSFHYPRFLKQELLDWYFLVFLKPLRISQQEGNTRLALSSSSVTEWHSPPPNHPPEMLLFLLLKVKRAKKKSTFLHQLGPTDELSDAKDSQSTSC